MFREFWNKAGFSEYTNDSFKVPFNEADPINTPRELKITVQTRQALGDAIAYFQNEGIALDASLGELQYVLDVGKNNQNIPMHGGYGSEGIFNIARGEELMRLVIILLIMAQPICSQ